MLQLLFITHLKLVAQCFLMLADVP